MGMAATAAIPELERVAMVDDDPDARQAIEAAIQEIRKQSPEADLKGDMDRGRLAP